MSRIYIHIGLPKTGTTAIQHYLQEHRGILEDTDIHYIDTNLSMPVTACLLAASIHESSRVADTVHYRKNEYLLGGVVPLSHGYFDESIQKKYFAAIKKELHDNKNKICIFSCEFLSFAGMCGVDKKEFTTLFSDIFANQIINIISYIRRLDRSIISIYKEIIKSGLATPLQDRLSNYARPTTEEYLFPNRIKKLIQANHPNCTPEIPLQLYSGLVGKNNIILREYKEDPDFDIIDDFLSLFSLKKEETQRRENINISLTNKLASCRLAYGGDTSTFDEDIASRAIISSATLDNVGKIEASAQLAIQKSIHTLQEDFHFYQEPVSSDIREGIVSPLSEFETFICAALGKISKQNNQLLDMLHQATSPASDFHSGRCPLFSSPGVSAKKYAEQTEQIIASRWFTSRGPYVKELESSLEVFLQVPFATLCANDSLMWMMLLHAENLQGKRIILSPCMPPKLLAALRWCRCHPMFIDIDKSTFSLSKDMLYQTLRQGAADAVILHHSIMDWHDISPLQDICRQHGILSILDATGAFGSTIGGKSLLDFGEYAVCSLHASQIFHTAEGGLIISRSTRARNRLEAIRSGGQSGPIHLCYGINGHMSELHGAFGLSLLPYVMQGIEIRKRHAEYYRLHLADSKVRTPHYSTNFISNYATYPVLFSDAETAKTAMERLIMLNIYPRYPYNPILTQLPYLENQYYRDCPTALDISRRLLHLPIFTEIPEERLHEIVATLATI